MAELSLDELMMVLLEDLPLTEERGFEGPGTYTTCPICAQALRWPDPALEFQFPGPVPVVTNPGLADFEQELEAHLNSHDRMQIYRVLVRLVAEARAGRVFRRRIEAVLAG